MKEKREMMNGEAKGEKFVVRRNALEGGEIDRE